MALVTAYEVPRAEPVIIAVADQLPAVANTNTIELNPCNCGVPASVSKPVKVVSLSVRSRNQIRKPLYFQYIFIKRRRPTNKSRLMGEKVDISLTALCMPMGMCASVWREQGYNIQCLLTSCGGYKWHEVHRRKKEETGCPIEACSMIGDFPHLRSLLLRLTLSISRS